MAVSQKFDPKTRVFESDLLEALSRTHPAIPALFWVPVSIGTLVWGFLHLTPWYAIVGAYALGVLVWTFAEYVLHRWVFHWVPTNKTLRRYYYLAHQVHHDQQEWDRLVMPVPMALFLSIPILGTLSLIAGNQWMWPIFGGVVLGYLGYDYIHLYTHYGKPTSRLMKGLRRRHQQHHHAFHDRWFGVSSPLWDYVFRTHVRRGERPTATHEEPIDWGRPDFSAAE